MRGQAFVTFPNHILSASAMEEVNGYVLRDKPMVMSFAKDILPDRQDNFVNNNTETSKETSETLEER